MSSNYQAPVGNFRGCQELDFLSLELLELEDVLELSDEDDEAFEEESSFLLAELFFDDPPLA